MNNGIIVENIKKRYGETDAVKGISFSVQPGEIFGLLGPNGAGKTTTLEILEGLRAPDTGKALIAGVDPQAQPRQLRDVIGVQLQSGGLPESMTPDEAMALFCAYHGRPPRTDLLDRFGLAEKRKSQYHQLSTGQKRRLALALAIAHEPQVLFLDEPTAGLDVASRAALHAVMAELKSTGTTILLATHDMAEAEALCDRVAILLDGRLAVTGTPLELTAAGAGMSRIAVRTTLNLLQGNHHNPPAVTHRQEKDEYVIYFSSNIGQTVSWLIDLVGERGDELIDLRVERPSLEDRFLELTNN